MLLCIAASAGVCLGSVLAYSFLTPAAEPAKKPHRRRTTTTGQESEPSTPRRTQEDAAFDNYQLMLVVNNELHLVDCECMVLRSVHLPSAELAV